MNMTPWLLPMLWSLPAAGQAFVDPVDDMLDGGPATVFVAPFQPRNAAAAGLAGMMSSFLEAELMRLPDLNIIPLDDVPAVHDMSATLYLDSCPPGKQVGCAFVVGQGGGADYALTGTVQSDAEGSRVEISIIDVRSSREAMSFVAVLDVGEDERFAEGVASVLFAVVRGEAGRVEDIRDMSVASAPDYSAAAAQLAQLSSELGDIQASAKPTGTVIVPPMVTVEEISERMEREGVKPWERLGLNPDEYLRWKNSGEDLATWRSRHDGRKQKLIVRAGLGFLNGPMNGLYRGILATKIDNGQGTPVEGYSWQAMLSGSGFASEFALGYGITPELEAGVMMGFASGQYQTRFEEIVYDINTGDPIESGDNPDFKYTNSNFFVGPYLQYVFRPANRFRPLAGLGMLHWVGDTVDSKEKVKEGLGTFDTPTLLILQARGGVELQVSKQLDVFVHVPVTVNLGGSPTDVYSKGEALNPETQEPYIQAGQDKPPAASLIGGGLLIGVQMKLFGRKHK